MIFLRPERQDAFSPDQPGESLKERDMPRCARVFALIALATTIASQSSALAGPLVPIKGTLNAQNQLNSSILPFYNCHDDQVVVPIDGTASGNLSHLGKVTADLSFGLGFSPIPGTADYVIPADFVGVLDFTAANGDHLYATFTGDYDYPGSPGFVATLKFVGGTGRFADATGTATLTGTDVPGSGGYAFTSTIDGSISY